MATTSSNIENSTNTWNAPSAQPLILVADDDADTRLMFRTMLEFRGYSVIEAADGEEVIQLAESARPDLILMDISLPRVNGLEAARRIRQSGHAGRVPVVFISGHPEASFLALAREAGGDEYLVKPLSRGQLGGVLEKYLGHHARAFAI